MTSEPTWIFWSLWWFVVGLCAVFAFVVACMVFDLAREAWRLLPDRDSKAPPR